MSNRVIHRRFRGPRFKWDDIADERLRELWISPETTAKGIAVTLGLRRQQVTTRARKLGWEKPLKPNGIRLMSIAGDVAEFFIPGVGDCHIVSVNTGDVEIVLARTWHVHRGPNGNLYVYACDPNEKLHRVIAKAPNGVLVDHRDRDGLNNCRSNLRFATSTQNTHNSGRRRNSKSEFKGVWQHVSGPFGGAIADLSGRRRSIGYYRTEIEAARAHDALAAILHGDFAYLNLPDDRMSEEEIMANKTLCKHWLSYGSYRAAA